MLYTREIQDHLRELYGLEVLPDLVSAVTDSVLEEVAEWQNRLLERLHPPVSLDALRVKVRDEGTVRKKAVYVALGAASTAPMKCSASRSRRPRVPSSGCAL